MPVPSVHTHYYIYIRRYLFIFYLHDPKAENPPRTTEIAPVAVASSCALQQSGKQRKCNHRKDNLVTQSISKNVLAMALFLCLPDWLLTSGAAGGGPTAADTDNMRMKKSAEQCLKLLNFVFVFWLWAYGSVRYVSAN